MSPAEGFKVSLYIVYEYIITTFKIPGQVFSIAMFIAAGPTAARFSAWADRLGESAGVLEAGGQDGIRDGLLLIHLDAQALLAAPVKALCCAPASTRRAGVGR